MHIVEVAAEFAPIAKVGGLGDVLTGLSRELTRLHEEVEVILPKYDFISPHLLHNLRLEIEEFSSLENGRQYTNAMWSAESEGCQLRLLESHHPADYFHRGKIYGCEDDIPRFLYFSRAVAEYLKLKNRPIDILHLHDWHVSALAPLVRDLFSRQIKVKAIVLTIHNVDYQGLCSPDDVAAIGLTDPTKFRNDDPKYPHLINLLKGGVVYADSIVAVSPTYAKEILTSEQGGHLDASLRKNKQKLTGILNGIDAQLWDPATDPHLTASYTSTDSIAKIVQAKKTNKEALAKQFCLDASRPWFGSICRLVPQKAPELLAQALPYILKLNGTFTLLGSSPTPAIQKQFDELKSLYPGALLHFEYNEPLSHQLYSALDFFLMPSHFEPCGLTQLIAMHYGALPIAHSTGGLRDTVFDCEDPLIPNAQRNGFTFLPPTFPAFQAGIDRASRLYRTDPATFQTIQKRNMQLDVSWAHPTQAYLRLFNNLITNKQT